MHGGHTAKTPPLVWAGSIALGLAFVVLGLTDTSGPECGRPGMCKCLPGVVLAGRALWIGGGAAFAGMGALRLVSGRRPWATAAALVAGAVDLGVGAWLAYAVVSGVIPLTEPFYVPWMLLVTVSTTGFGVGFFASALSDRMMDRFRDDGRPSRPADCWPGRHASEPSGRCMGGGTT